MEAATRAPWSANRFVNGLGRCLERDINLSFAARQQIAQVKQAGLKLFAPEKGGSYEIFNQRPLSKDIKMYCIQDVQYMPMLWQQYSKKMTGATRTKVKIASKDRVTESQAKDYNPHSRNKAYLPLGW